MGQTSAPVDLPIDILPRPRSGGSAGRLTGYINDRVISTKKHESFNRLSVGRYLRQILGVFVRFLRV